MKCEKCHGTGEVPDPVPEWIEDLGGPDVPYALLRVIAAAFRAHVEERAKAAAERIAQINFRKPAGEFAPSSECEPIIREEMCK